MSTQPKHYLSDMDLDEISTVLRGDNTGADILIVKNMPGVHDLHHEDTLDAKDFRYSRGKKRKKNTKRLRDDAFACIEKMGGEENVDLSHRRLR